MKLGQLQWAIFWLSIINPAFFVVWLLTLLFTDFDKYKYGD